MVWYVRIIGHTPKQGASLLLEVNAACVIISSAKTATRTYWVAFDSSSKMHIGQSPDTSHGPSAWQAARAVRERLHSMAGCMQAALAELEKVCPGLEDEVASLRAALESAQPENSVEAAAKRLERMRQLFTTAQSHSAGQASGQPKEPPTPSPVRQPAAAARAYDSKQQMPQAATSATSGLAGLGVDVMVKRQKVLRRGSASARGHQQQTSPAASASLAVPKSNALVKATMPPRLLEAPARGPRAPAESAKATATLQPDACRRGIARGTCKQPTARGPSTRPCNAPAVPNACGRHLAIAKSWQQSKAPDGPMSPNTGPAHAPGAAALPKAHAYRVGRDSLRSKRKQPCEEAAAPGTCTDPPHGPGAAAAPGSHVHGKSKSRSKPHCDAACLSEPANAAKLAMGEKMCAAEDANSKGQAAMETVMPRPAYAKALLTIPHRLGSKARHNTEVHCLRQLHHKGIAGSLVQCTLMSSAQCSHVLIQFACQVTCSGMTALQVKAKAKHAPQAKHAPGGLTQ